VYPKLCSDYQFLAVLALFWHQKVKINSTPKWKIWRQSEKQEEIPIPTHPHPLSARKEG
jgi:hypothetical protein